MFVKKKNGEKWAKEKEDDAEIWNILNIGHMIIIMLLLVDMCIKLFYKMETYYTSHGNGVTDKVQKCVISLKAKKYFLIVDKKKYPFIKLRLNSN